MRISIFGLGHVGAVSGACLAQSGHEVTVVDSDLDKVKRVRSGHAPVAEPGLDELIAAAIAEGALKATMSCEEAVMNSDLSMICVDTPCNGDDQPVQDRIRSVCSRIGVVIGQKSSHHSVVLRSACTPGTAHSVAIPTLEDCSKMTAGADFGFAGNPAFLRAGTAVHDYFNPPKIVIGALDERTARAVSSLYLGINAPEVITQIRIAEAICSHKAVDRLCLGAPRNMPSMSKTSRAGMNGGMPEHLWMLLCAACEIEKKSLSAVQTCMRFSDDPAARAKLNAHVSETRWQIKLLDACLDIYDIDKTRYGAMTAGAVPASAQGNLLAIKRIEIGVYEKIISIARKQHVPDILQACREILEQEWTMAEWIEDNPALMHIPLAVAA